MSSTVSLTLPAGLVQELSRRAAEMGLDTPGYIQWMLRTHGRIAVTPSLPDEHKHSHTIQTPSRTYRAVVTSGRLGTLGDLARAVAPGSKALLVVDAALPLTRVDHLRDPLAAAGYVVSVASVTASEPAKTLATASTILQSLLASKHERTDPVISLGGGVVTDLAGFVAASYRRGVPVIHCPTTLLAMVDAAIGGKTGVNLELPDGTLAKNMVGAFWQPHLVICDTDTLKTLPPRHLRCGMAECLKHSLISAALPPGQGLDDSLWAWTLVNLEKCLALDPAAITELIARNVSVKAGVVSSDEREEAPPTQGGRALLNLGHTFAHAIETVPGVSVCHGVVTESRTAGIHHGEAVAYGLIAAAAASHSMGMIPAHDVDAVRSAVGRLGLSARLSGLPHDEALLERMSHDKKASGGKLRLILLKSLGEACVVEDPPSHAVRAGWAAIRAGT